MLEFILPVLFFGMFFCFDWYVIHTTFKYAKWDGLRKSFYVTGGVFLTTILFMFLRYFTGFEFFGVVMFYVQTILFVGFFVVLIVDVVFRVLKLKNLKLGLIVIVGVLFVFFSYGVWNANQLDVKTVDIDSSKVSDVRMVQLTDIHVGSRSPEFLEKIVDRTIGLNPDVVVITGDLIDSEHVTVEDLDSLKKFDVPVYYIYGNHEAYARKAYRDFYETNGLIVLDDEVASFENLEFVGINYYKGMSSGARSPSVKIGEVVDGFDVDYSKYTVLLNHEPDQIDDVAQRGIDLMLAGHTHAGQIFPFNFLVRLRYDYVYGLFDVENMKLYVSSGTGTWGPVVRVGSKNEIVVFDF